MTYELSAEDKMDIADEVAGDMPFIKDMSEEQIVVLWMRLFAGG